MEETGNNDVIFPPLQFGFCVASNSQKKSTFDAIFYLFIETCFFLFFLHQSIESRDAKGGTADV